MTTLTKNLVLTRGLTFPSFTISCFQEPDFTTASDLTGWVPWAEVRSDPDQALILNLLPFISNAVGGIVTVPAIQDEQTILLVDGKYKWDFIMQDAAGQRLGPYIKGSFTIKSKITQGNPPE